MDKPGQVAYISHIYVLDDEAMQLPNIISIGEVDWAAEGETAGRGCGGMDSGIQKKWKRHGVAIDERGSPQLSQGRRCSI